MRLTIAPAWAGLAIRRMSVAVSAALVLAAAVPGGQSSPEAGVLRDAPAYEGFSFSPGTCELGPEFCAVTGPGGWSATEIALLRAALAEISASDLGRRIAERAGGNGFHTLRRFANAAEPNAHGGYEAQPLIVATTHTDATHSIRSIDLTDRFFERASARDHFSGQPGYLLTTEILTHELVHAMDLGQQYSGTPEFRRVAKLGATGNQQRQADRVNLEREQLNVERRYEDSWQVSRTFGIVTLRGRLPSVQALDSYREAFAEFGADLVLDPNSRRRLEPRLIRYFESAVSDVAR
jgi:hypothetical protein